MFLPYQIRLRFKPILLIWRMKTMICIHTKVLITINLHFILRNVEVHSIIWKWKLHQLEVRVKQILHLNFYQYLQNVYTAKKHLKLSSWVLTGNLIERFTQGQFTSNHLPTIAETYETGIFLNFGNQLKQFDLEICDFHGKFKDDFPEICTEKKFRIRWFYCGLQQRWTWQFSKGCRNCSWYK